MTNLTISSLIEAVRDQTRTVDFKHSYSESLIHRFTPLILNFEKPAVSIEPKRERTGTLQELAHDPRCREASWSAVIFHCFGLAQTSIRSQSPQSCLHNPLGHPKF